MTIPDLNTPGVPQAAAHVFTWLADKVQGGAKRAFGWGWERGQWIAAQDRYDEQIIKQYGWIRIFGQTTPKPLREVFTDVYMLDKPTAFSRSDPDALRKHLWDEDRSVPFRFGERLPAEEVLSRGSKFFILGKPGAGKTTFLKRLAVREAQRGKWGRCIGKIPIFVPLKQFAESGKSLFDFIVEQFAVCHFPDAAPFVERLLKEGKALVLFDGLDEVTKAADVREDQRSHVTAMIDQFSRQYDLCHIVVTCRIAATEYTFPSPFIYLEVADFAPDQVDAFVRNWFWDTADAERSAGLAARMLTEWARPEHAGIRDLGRNPLLLTLLCLNYAETLSFPARRVEIYQEALDGLLKKWDASRQVQRGSLYKALSLGRKQQMFSRIAHDGFLQDEILFGQADLEARLKAYLAHVPEVPDPIDIDAEAVLREIVEQHGIFVEQARGLFSFAHLTFQEYYAARHIAASPAAEAFNPLMARVTDNKWREVVLLTASLLPDATHFLASFERTRNRLIALRPRLIGWLRWIDTQAATSRAAYSRPATRVVYARISSLDHVRVSAGDRGDRTSDRYALHDRGLALKSLRTTRALDPILDLDRAHALNLRRALALAREKPAGDLCFRLEEIRNLCYREADPALKEALSELVWPTETSTPTRWNLFAKQLAGVIESCRVFKNLRCLDAEAQSLLNSDLPLDEEDLKAWSRYLGATELFYDCLQLAYTPDRRAFEDRILLPPPLDA